MTAALSLLLTALVCRPSAQEPQPTFRTSTRLVEVSVVVTDRAGKLVPGLTRDDFTIAEDGIPHAISIFEANDTREPRANAAAAVDESGPSGLFTNTVRDASGSTAVLVFDRLNAAFDSQWFARKHLDRYLTTMRSGDRIALYVLDGGIRVLHDFSDNASSLRAALDLYRARVTGDYDASNEPPADLSGGGGSLPVWIVDPSTSVSDFFTGRRWRNTFGAMQVLARHLSGVAGRKSVVWVSEAFPIPTGLDRSEFLEEMRKTTRAMNDAQASLYPVDSRGLVGAISYARGKARFTTLSDVRGKIETMESVAEDTGGRAFANTNALDMSIGRAVDDSRLTYLLGYYPSDSRLDGRFRTIDVKVTKKGLNVRFRHGYVASEPAADQKGRDAALREALEGPLAATQVGLSARTDYDKPSSTVTIQLMIDASPLALESEDGRWRGAVDVLVAEVSRNARGNIVRTETLDVFIADGERAAVLQDGLPLTLTVDITRYLHELRIVARDVRSGRVGSLVIPAARLLR